MPSGYLADAHAHIHRSQLSRRHLRSALSKISRGVERRQCVTLLGSFTVSPRDLMRMFPAHLNGQQHILSGEAFILTSQESLDIARLSVRWKLCEERFRRMQSDSGWKMVISRTDIQESCRSYCLFRCNLTLTTIPVTTPIPLSQWRVVGSTT